MVVVFNSEVKHILEHMMVIVMVLQYQVVMAEQYNIELVQQEHGLVQHQQEKMLEQQLFMFK